LHNFYELKNMCELNAPSLENAILKLRGNAPLSFVFFQKETRRRERSRRVFA